MKAETRCKKCGKTQVETVVNMICICGGGKEIIGFNTGSCSYDSKTHKVNYPVNIHLS